MRRGRLTSAGTLRLPEGDARRMLLVRAIEQSDSQAGLLTQDDRSHIGAAAQFEPPGSRPGPAGFIARRAALALERLGPRYPVVAKVEGLARWPRWIEPPLLVFALGFGWAGTTIFELKQLNLINTPLLAALLWNAVVYLVIITMLLRRLISDRAAPEKRGPVAYVIDRAMTPRLKLRAQPVLAAALARFTSDWLSIAAPLNAARVHRGLHLAAAAVGTGIILGIYTAGLNVAYRAGWESSILSVETVHRGLQLVFGAASQLTGIELPTLAQLQALNFERGSPGERAEPWMHLIAVTALLFIVVPRLVLAGVHAARAAQLRRGLRVPGKEDFYVRTLLRTAAGSSASVRVIPYSYSVSDETIDRLRRLVTRVLGERTQLTVEASIPYGGEDEWLSSAGSALDSEDHIIVLFNLSATPEAENHGALVLGLRDRLKTSGAAVAVVLDETNMRRNLGVQGEARVVSRRTAWQAMLHVHAVDPVALDLSSDDVSTLGPLLEAKLVAQSIDRKQ